LDASSVSDLGPGGVTTHVNKALSLALPKQLGEGENWLRDVANEMQIEDGVFWIYGVGDGGSWRLPTSGSKT
jgi:hypothetical protein